MKFINQSLILSTLIVLSGLIINSRTTLAQERPLGIVRYFKPNVELKTSERGIYELDLDENKGEQIFDGDTLSTDESGYAYIIFVDNSIAKLRPETQLMVRGESRADSKISDRRIDLEQGSILLELQPIDAGTFEVQTSRSLASVKGTTFGNSSEGYIWVTEGQVDLTALNSGQTISLFEGMYGQVDPEGNGVESGTVDEETLSSLNNDYGELDEEFEEKTIIIRFRDANGQIRTEEIKILEKGN